MSTMLLLFMFMALASTLLLFMLLVSTTMFTASIDQFFVVSMFVIFFQFCANLSIVVDNEKLIARFRHHPLFYILADVSSLSLLPLSLYLLYISLSLSLYLQYLSPPLSLYYLSLYTFNISLPPIPLSPSLLHAFSLVSTLSHLLKGASNGKPVNTLVPITISLSFSYSFAFMSLNNPSPSSLFRFLSTGAHEIRI